MTKSRVFSEIFPKLSEDIVQQIFAFDTTFRVEMKRSLECIVTPRIKALQMFLFREACFPPSADSFHIGSEFGFHTMKHICFQGNSHYIKIQYDGMTEMVFYVMSLSEKDNLDCTRDTTSPMIVRQRLHLLNSHVSDVSERQRRNILRSQRSYERGHITKDKCNHEIYNILGADGYDRLVRHKIESGEYNREIHEYLFRPYFNAMDDLYFPEDGDNYRYYSHGGEDYMIFWNICVHTLFL